MALSVNTNVASLTAQRNLLDSSSRLNTSLGRLSTGLKINSAADDASGLVISENQRAQISGLTQAIANIDRGVNLIQTAEAGLGEINSALVSIRSLAVDSANSATNDSDALAANQAEVDELIATINDISDRTQFGSINLLDGTFTGAERRFHTGAFIGESSTKEIANADFATISGSSVLAIDSGASANAAIQTIDAAISSVANTRADLGAFQAHRLERTQSNVRTELTNLEAAESTVRDTDFATEIARFTNEQIRSQAATTVLGLANQNAQGILSLLG